MKKDTSWGGVAAWYNELLSDSDDSYQKNVILPNLKRIVSPEKGMLLIDVACGQGYFSHAFAAHGAQVIGCDVSPELIEIAKSKNQSLAPLAKQKEATEAKQSAEFKVAPADNLSSLKMEGKADVVTIIMALQNIENMHGAISECFKVLKPDGRLVLAMNHPAFRIPQRSDWGWDEAKKVQYRRLDAYMSDDRIKIDMTPGEKDTKKKRFTISFHRPLQAYFKALNKAGFSVTKLEEWISHKKSQAGPRAAEEDRMRKEIPMFVCIEAKKS